MKWLRAFDRAGFNAIDVHMSDLQKGRHHLQDFNALVACGGFSYGDVLGAGGGWAKSILFNTALRDQFSAFFHRQDTLALGVCNGCQMLSNLAEIIPGTENWGRFVRNKSERFEAVLQWFALTSIIPYGLTECRDHICRLRFLMVKDELNLSMGSAVAKH